MSEKPEKYDERKLEVRTIEIHHDDTQPFMIEKRKLYESVEPDDHGCIHTVIDLIISKNGESITVNTEEAKDMIAAINQLLSAG